MVEIKLQFENWAEARRVEDCLAMYSQVMTFAQEDRGAMLRAAIQVHEQLFELMEKENG